MSAHRSTLKFASEESCGHTQPLWSAAGALHETQPLRDSIEVDVCVIGAGIAGLTTAYLLAREGRSVAVLEDGLIGGGQTERTTAHLSSAIDNRYVEVERLLGREGARVAAQSHAAAIDKIESICADEGIACGFERVDGYLFDPPGRDDSLLERELEAANAAGVPGVVLVPQAPITSFDTGRCLKFPNQGQFHPLRYLAGLTTAASLHGARVFTNTHADTISEERRNRITVDTGALVTANAIVVATNSPITPGLAIHAKQAPYLSYVIAAPVPGGYLDRALYWDTEDPYHYVRLAAQSGSGAGEDLLVVGGEDHKVGQADDGEERYARLEAWARSRFGAMGHIAYRWSGEVLETIDGLAFIGRNPRNRNVYIATGDSGMGMTHGTIAGMILTDLIAGRANSWAEQYDPGRITPAAAMTYVRENANVAAQYTKWLAPGEARSPEDIPPGCGAIVWRGLKKLAVYRSENGILCERSAVCPHAGCLVTWNAGEQTWDCPCHGSRFDCFGHVLQGPANDDLPPAGK
jgi:glycine/D-amino acid oxidase-like deaminating enzyme/nitrite reductase/ring-hydroxylating ferredoxin subunit